MRVPKTPGASQHNGSEPIKLVILSQHQGSREPRNVGRVAGQAERFRTDRTLSNRWGLRRGWLPV